MRVLHVEVGGAYGGSLKALETYLAFSDRTHFEHDLLLYYPTPGVERLKPWVRKLWALYDAPTSDERTRRRRRVTIRLRERLRSSAARSILIELSRWIDLARGLPSALRLTWQLRRGRYDVIHVNNTFTYQPLTLGAARIAHLPVVAHARGPVARGPFSKAILCLADYVVTVNKSIERELKTWGSRVEAHTCYDGVIPRSPDAAAVQQLRASLAPDGGILIGSVGRLSEEKGYQDLVRAAKHVVKIYPDVRFAIAGEGPSRALLQTLIEELGLTGRFQLCGFRWDVENFLAALDIFVCASAWEGGPLVAVEAMLLGKPVVTTAVGFTPEIINPGESGVLVRPGDPRALAEALLEALGNRAGLTRGALEQRHRAAKLTDPLSNARRFEEILQAAIGRMCPWSRDRSGQQPCP
jgi:glycosyltransferase involved in cell wall biosynthesis